MDTEGGKPINANFETLGFEHHLLFNNFGTLGFILALLPLFYLLFYMIDPCCGEYRLCRRMGKRLHGYLFWGVLLRMIIESYIISLSKRK